jgi:DUF4097 and DUF4098 domain-containing protein YvlB
VVALSSPSKPGTLSVRLVSGSISVVGYNGKEVVIDAAGQEPHGRTSSRKEKAAVAEGLHRIDNAAGFELTAVEKDNRVTVKADSWRRPVDLVIKVPRNFSLQIATVQNGDIVVDNVNGELDINNVNGDIRLTQIAGSALLNTVNGSMTAVFTAVTPNSPMAFSSVNGKIDVTLPAKVKANLKLKTDMGGIYSDFDMDVAQATKPVTTSKGGVYRISQDNWTYGKLNGGGAEIMMKSLQGNIYVRKVK